MASRNDESESPQLCPGIKRCPPACNDQCSDDDPKCHWLCETPGADLLGHAVDIRAYTDMLTQIPFSTTTISETVLPESLFNETLDFKAGQWDLPVGKGGD